VTGPGWSGRPGWRPAGGLEEIEPFLLAVPAFGQVHGDAAAAVAGGPGGDVDEVAADGDAAGSGVEGSGEGAGGAGQVVGDGRAGEPRGVRGEVPGRYLQSVSRCL
jgi:hypothetical protein